jgi:uncharacterized membrane protein YfcA
MPYDIDQHAQNTALEELMASKQPSWEGTILAFMVILSVLIGVGYVIALNFRIPVPWLALTIIALGIALGARFARKQRP